MSRDELARLLQEEIYPKLTEETVEALVLLGDEYEQGEWNFYMALYQFLLAMQMSEANRTGAMLLVKHFVTLIGLEWDPFVKACSLAIRDSDPRLKSLVNEEEGAE